MSKRYRGRMNGERYLANANPTQLEVHDLDNEQTGPQQCQIDKIIAAGHEQPYNDLNAAIAAGYDRCNWCIGRSTR